jgi:flavorubredoxin
VEWSKQKPKRKAVVVYDTMWHSTETMAEAIVDALAQEGVYAIPLHLRTNHRSDIMTEILDAGAVIIGSPTINNGLFPTISDFLTYMKGLKPENKIGAAFGSYGWSGEAVNLVKSTLEDMKFEVIDPGVRVQYVPDEKGLAACRELATKIAKALPTE